MGWRDKAREKLDPRHDRHKRAQKVQRRPNVPNVPIVPASPSRVLKYWHDRLSALDIGQPPDGIDVKDWAQLCDDCWWLYEAHASYAVRNGWAAQSLFGVNFDNLLLGGLAQLLQGSRSLVFDGPRAKAKCWGVTFDRNAECVPVDTPLIWDLKT